jgi:hypothetical protein
VRRDAVPARKVCADASIGQRAGRTPSWLGGGGRRLAQQGRKALAQLAERDKMAGR